MADSTDYGVTAGPCSQPPPGAGLVVKPCHITTSGGSDKEPVLIPNFLFPVSTSDGKVHVGQVQERTAARKIYDAAKKKGKTAGLVATKSVGNKKNGRVINLPFQR